jgi:hypothetical protein
MSIQAVLAPVFVLVGWTFLILLWVGIRRLDAVRNGRVRLQDVALSAQNWPAPALQAGDAFNNQFQIPVLFYVLAILALFLHKADLLFVVLSWIFVVSRIIHAGIPLTSNNINQRFSAYAVGVIVLLIMCIIFAVRILLNI